MARVEIPVQKMQSHSILVNPSETDSDATENHYIVNTGRERLHGKNTGVGAVQLTIVATNDNLRRAVDVVASIQAGGEFECEILPTEGFNQADGTVHIDVDTDTDLKLWLTKLEG